MRNAFMLLELVIDTSSERADYQHSLECFQFDKRSILVQTTVRQSILVIMHFMSFVYLFFVLPYIESSSYSLLCSVLD